MKLKLYYHQVYCYYLQYLLVDLLMVMTSKSSFGLLAEPSYV